jgi:hypothetical protein
VQAIDTTFVCSYQCCCDGLKLTCNVTCHDDDCNFLSHDCLCRPFFWVGGRVSLKGLSICLVMPPGVFLAFFSASGVACSLLSSTSRPCSYYDDSRRLQWMATWPSLLHTFASFRGQYKCSFNIHYSRFPYAIPMKGACSSVCQDTSRGRLVCCH